MGQQDTLRDLIDEWKDEKPRKRKIPQSNAKVDLASKVDVFKRTGILSETDFDEVYNVYRLPSNSRRAAQQTVQVITNSGLYDDPEVREFPVTYKIDDPIDAAILLQSQETDVILQALEALIAFAEGRFSFSTANSTGVPGNSTEEEGDTYFKATLVNEPGFLQRVVELVTHPRKSVCRRAAILFGSLTQIEETLLQLEDANLANVLALITTETEPVVLDWLSLALRNVSALHSIQLIILESNLLEGLLDLALYDNQDPDVVENIVESLCNLTSDHKIREFLVLNGGFEVAVELALSEFPSTQYQALRLLRDLLASPVEGAIDRFHEADGMATLLSLINAKELQFLHASTLEILEQLMGIPSIATILSHKKIYDFLLDMALSKDYQETDTVQTFALRCVARAANFPDERLLMNNCGAEKKILQLLKLKSFSVQKTALEAMGSLAGTLSCRRRLRDHGVVKQTVIFLESRDPFVRSSAFFAVGALIAQDSALQEEYLKENFLDILLGTLEDDRSSIQGSLLSNALQCLINLSETEAKKEAMEKVVLKNLVTWLTIPVETVKTKALTIAVIFVRKESARAQFSRLKGFEAIAQILQEHCTDELTRSVCWAISTLAVQKSSVFSLVKSGCVLPLMDAKREEAPVTSGAALLALQRLSRVHLPFKLALFDKLDAVDRINHGFYDSGSLAGNCNFSSLRELLKIRVRSKVLTSPVVYVSLPKKKFVSAESKISAVEDIRDTEGVSDEPVRTISPVSVGKTVRISPIPVRKSLTSPLQIIECDSADRNLRKALKSAVKKQSTPLPEIPPAAEPPLSSSVPLRSSKSSFPTGYKIQKDRELKNLIRQVLTESHKTNSMDEEIRIIARAVVAKMGGSSSGTSTSANASLRNLMKKYKSICIPIGSISHSGSYYRAYLFKVLADRIYVPVTFQRGPGGTGWNETVLIQPIGTTCVVDLMINIGDLISKESEQASKYLDFLRTAENTREPENQTTAPAVNIACRYDPDEVKPEPKFSTSEISSGLSSLAEGLAVVGKHISATGDSVESLESFPSANSFTDLTQSKFWPRKMWLNLSAWKHPSWKRLQLMINQERSTTADITARKASERKAIEEAALAPPNTREKLSVIPAANTATLSNTKKVKGEQKRPYTKWGPKKSAAFRAPRVLRATEITHNRQPEADALQTETQKTTPDVEARKIEQKNLLDSSSDSDDFDWEVYSKKDRTPLPVPSASEDVFLAEELDEHEKDSGWEMLTKSEQQRLEQWEMDFQEDDLESSQSDNEENEKARRSKAMSPFGASR